MMITDDILSAVKSDSTLIGASGTFDINNSSSDVVKAHAKMDNSSTPKLQFNIFDSVNNNSKFVQIGTNYNCRSDFHKAFENGSLVLSNQNSNLSYISSGVENGSSQPETSSNVEITITKDANGRYTLSSANGNMLTDLDVKGVRFDNHHGIGECSN
jgi:hypothetical protein